MDNFSPQTFANNWRVIAIAVVVLLVLGVAGVFFRKRRPQLDRAHSQKRWQEVQRLCGKGDTWAMAVIEADKLLDDTLKMLRYKGKSMGERLVAAQRDITDNDGAWFGHKLRNKIVHEEIPRLYQKDVKNALRGFRQALKDLGAIK